MSSPRIVYALLAAVLLLQSVFCSVAPAVTLKDNVTYIGINKGDVEQFRKMQYGVDTGGARRFRPPEPFVATPNTVFDAQAYGPSCPQPVSGILPWTSNATEQSEDCLSLAVTRPARAVTNSPKLPVFVYVYGGSLYRGHIDERTLDPSALVAESVANGHPIIYVAMNYRLNFFGFALTDALRRENSLNSGLKDQRLALQWVRDNIEDFGGDPDRITLCGQSSGALSVALQMLAYGGTKGAPFSQGIMQSTALEPGITGNITTNTTNAVAGLVGCIHDGKAQSEETLDCLRSVPWEKLLNATIAHQDATSTQNNGDTFLPVVDGDFLPDAPSILTAAGNFTPMRVLIGWDDDDATLFTPVTTSTSAATRAFISLIWPGLQPSTLDHLLALYPPPDFRPNASANLTAEFYRAARIFRDIIFACPSFLLGHAVARAGADVYYFDNNQTILADIFAGTYGARGFGATHKSELPYIFGNLSLYDVAAGYGPAPEDFVLARTLSRTWSLFAAVGTPSVRGLDVLQGWLPSYTSGGVEAVEDASVYVIGGPEPGLAALGGHGSFGDTVRAQKLPERCAFLNSDEVVKQLLY
ncbi:Carboxylesterase type B [Macrophomina phaseolina MS6]|uniref:Carboxylic ester hydrolase n=1 Tax=Macrophomina phaseolina (strain MS6) TaxID=1126212 RepID=K2S9S2_MACPH|nr:Carboxylesterase type B [Macrophomina phaseolina MS6]